MGFATSLNFTSANEDGATELAALALSPSDHVLCLTASGARPLDLLLGNPSKVTALDFNAVQNQLLALKIAAIRTLSNDRLHAYLGLTPCGDRLDLHRLVESALNVSSREFWRRRMGLIRRGVWYAGRWERVLRLGAAGTGMLRGRWIEALFNAPDLETQARIWDRHFDDRVWRGAIRLMSSRWFWTHIVGEPGGAFLPDAPTCEARLAGLFTRASGRIFFRESDFAWLVFRGRNDISALPLHLRPESLDIIRDRLDRITIVEGQLDRVDGLGLDPVDAFSLSDFGSYCDQPAYDACWRAVLATAAPGARFCERVFMNTIAVSPGPARRLTPDMALSERLTARDRAFIYDVRCGTIS